MEQAFDLTSLTQGAERPGRLDLDQGLPGPGCSFMLQRTIETRLARKEWASRPPNAFRRIVCGAAKIKSRFAD
jgi:hypothetical protein